MGPRTTGLLDACHWKQQLLVVAKQNDTPEEFHLELIASTYFLGLFLKKVPVPLFH